MITGIYTIVAPDGKIYVGQAINIHKRWIEHRGKRKTGRRLTQSFTIHGIESHKFEIAHQCSREELKHWERYYQDKFDACGDNGLNCILTGTASKLRFTVPETRALMSEALSKRVILDSTREKLSNALKGRVFSEEWKAKLKESKKNISQETIRKRTESRKNFKHTEETKIRIGLSGKGRKRTPESAAAGGFKRREILLNTETGIFYHGYDEAAATIVNMKKDTFRCNINGIRLENKTQFILCKAD